MRRPVTSVLAIAVAVIAAGCGGAARVATPPAAVAATTSPSSTVPVSLMGRVVTRMPTTSKVVALTFDGGANADGAASILATLQRKQVPATFFLTGNFATTFPTISRRLAAWGRLGNHTVSHPHTTRLSAASLRWQIW